MESPANDENKEFIEDFEMDDELLKKRTINYLATSKVVQMRESQSAPEKQIGPARQSTTQDDILKLKDLMLENLPSSEFYEKSYMHKDIVNNGKLVSDLSHRDS